MSFKDRATVALLPAPLSAAALLAGQDGHLLSVPQRKCGRQIRREEEVTLALGEV